MTISREHEAVLSGGGEMGALMRATDWTHTAVGPVAGWPQSLRTALSILLETGFPMYIAWGSGFTQFYNDGYRPILGSTKHPAAMGRSTRETFAEIWDIIGPMFHRVMEGTATTVVDFMLPLDRHGFVEECYFIFSYSPIREEGGRVGGVLVTVTETTARVLGARRLETSQALAARTRDARTVSEACRTAGSVLATAAMDIPFALVYLIAADRQRATLAASAGLDPGGPASPTLVDFKRPDNPYPLAEGMRSGRLEVVDGSHVPLTPSLPVSTRRVLVLPIIEQGAERPVGILVAATSPRLLMDDAYQDFLSLIASQIGTAIAGARMLEEAKARAEALADLDRAKTAFFNNVSHEFRTPLTLMLGPTEEALASPDRALVGEDLETVHRNEVRLLKLVNTLLDFSRIEAGRETATFEPTDLAALTMDLASAFRSAMERAGLQLVVECPPLPESIYVDREMWEKIVLNLLSNAMKFTFAGSVTVGLHWQGAQVELQVRDTGIGIAPGDLARVFERFHRIEHAKARTQEGSGIGLALVRELVAMHAGTITALSQPGEGTTLVVSIPTGSAHLPAERIGRASGRSPKEDGAAPYVEEALRWLPAASAAPPRVSRQAADRILVADDNADMREYVTRLLAPRWDVEAVSDGAAALEAARLRRPGVIVSDVMMPGLDGFQLLDTLRSDERTRTVPIILLSARAGEEARIEGLHAGADDYLVKPFSARELIACVESHLVRAKVREVEEAHATRLASVFKQAPVGIAVLRGPDHVFEFANSHYLGLVGGRQVAGKTVRAALPELEGQGIYELLDAAYQSGTPHVGRSERLLLDGPNGREEAFFDFVYQPLFDEHDQVTGIAVVAFDVSELTRARRRAESASRAKDEFLAMLGHELRNPLAPILTALQLMRLRQVSGGERERTVIERQVKHMVALVDDLLDVSRIARGKVQLKQEPVDLADVVAKAIEMTSPAIEERRHTLNVEVPRGLVVAGDPARLAQVVANLLTNAAKYTDQSGRIDIAGRAEASSAVLRVTDNGSGIAPDTLPMIFDLFAQEAQNVDRSQGGLGLGLAIVRSLVEAHGGTVAAHSAGKGSGSTFTLRLPLTGDHLPSSVAVPVGSATAAAPDGLRILVVDDNVDAAELLAESLEALGHVTAVAFDGPGALRDVETFAPDAVLLDLGLPVMDGFEVADHLRADPRFKNLVLVAITGYGQEMDRDRTRRVGFDAHIVKPVDLGQLHTWLHARRRGEEPPA